MVCGSCGEQNSDRSRFCSSCGSPLESPPEKREIRKTVSLVFTDLAGSTAMAEKLDPETVRRVMARYFTLMSSILERHGGVVEKYIGDAVLAVFGIPKLHEDDALRAVRAAVEMRDQMAVLNAELQADDGVALAVRTGVNTGEVVAGDPGSGQAFVSGDPVNVAARLEQHAGAGEILIGPDTYRMVRNAVVVEPVGPVEAKGKSEPLRPYRLLEVKLGAPGFARRLDSPFVGREHESNLVNQGFERALRERACHLFTILGPAGVGKSRLAADVLSHLPPGTQVARGRCLPYGDGITFWALGEVVRDLLSLPESVTRAEAAAALAGAVPEKERDALVEILLQLLGLASVTNGVDELSWAVRRFFEQRASDAPLVIVVDDISWAEPALLDTLEYIADWARSSPILLICVARPELLDERPNWGGGKLNATSMLLEPLDEEQSATLVRELLGDADLPVDVQKKIADTAEGNPLYVEQMLEMLIDNGYLVRDGGSWRSTQPADTISVPPTIHALLAARLDRLALNERQTIERASVIGKVFYSGAVREMTPASGRGELRHNLQTLVRKELVRPDEDRLVGEDSFRFRHILIRDAAYNGLSKQQRAELHRVFADWLEKRPQERLQDLQEIVAHHLSESYRYRSELGPVTDEARAIAVKAARLSRAAGRRAMNRGDAAAAGKLLTRAEHLLPQDSDERTELLLELVDLQNQIGDFDRANRLLDQIVASKDGPSVANRVAMARLLIQLMWAPGEASLEDLETGAVKGIAVAEETGDMRTLAMGWMIQLIVDLTRGQMGRGVESGRKALRYIRSSSDRSQEGEVMGWLFACLALGPMPIREAVAEIESEVQGPESLIVTCSAAVVKGTLLAYEGDLETGRELVEEGREMFRQLGNQINWAGLGQSAAEVEILAGDLPKACAVLEEACEVLDDIGERSFFSTCAGELAGHLCSLGRFEEAETWATKSRDVGAIEDVFTEVLWRAAFARIAASRGRAEEAVRWSDEAISMIEGTDAPLLPAVLYESRARMLIELGREEEARAALAMAIEPYESKGASAQVERLRRLYPTPT